MLYEVITAHINFDLAIAAVEVAGDDLAGLNDDFGRINDVLGSMIDQVETRLARIVITSYSIHYTKLYDQIEIDMGVHPQQQVLQHDGPIAVGSGQGRLPAFADRLSVAKPLVSLQVTSGKDHHQPPHAFAVIEKTAGFDAALHFGGDLAVERGRITSYNVCYTKLLRAGQ